MPKLVAVNKNAHKDIKVTEDKSFAHVKSSHIASLVVHEFARASQDYPIIFVKDSETEEYRAVAVFGLKPGENLFYDENGWKANYKPESIQAYPFMLAPDPEIKDRQILVMDEESSRINTEEGEALFDKDGEQTEFVTKFGTFLSDHIVKQKGTKEFIKVLLEYKLIIHQTLEISSVDKKKTNIDGMYVVSEEALNKLSDKDYLDLRKRGFLPPIYASLLSLSRIGDLVRMIGDKTEK
ncbi:MAG: SapC family protein [Kangiellaceae bacterium]|nr:SapC family protein [Kangiellaceae bacterium]